jgi:hypothetical protein
MVGVQEEVLSLENHLLQKKLQTLEKSPVAVLYFAVPGSFSENSTATSERQVLMETYFKTFHSYPSSLSNPRCRMHKFNYVREPYFGGVRFF